MCKHESEEYKVNSSLEEGGLVDLSNLENL